MRVCLVADPHVLSAEPLLNRMGKAQGLAMVQVRAKGWSGRSLARLTRRILKRVKHEAPEVKVLVNGRLDVALATGAAGVHLPARGLAVARVKEMVPEEFLVGVSAHCGGDLERARAAGADYAFVGPVFP
ncbi:MAG: thiamine phosphate synthase, partial [Acidobacteriota bacterium]